MRKKWRSWLAISGVLLISMMGTQEVFVDAKPSDTCIYEGVSVDHIDLSGKTKEEAKEIIDRYTKDLKSQKINIKTDLSKVGISLKDFGMKTDAKLVLENAYSYGKIGNIIRRYKEQADSRQHKINFDIKKTIDKKAWNKKLKEKENKLIVHAKNATVKRVNQSFQVIDEQYGQNIEYGKGYKDFVTYLNTKWEGKKGEFLLPTSVDEPKYKRADLEQVKDRLGSYTTSFGSSTLDRSQNITTGANHINGTVVYPDEEFSTYAKIAPYTYENGYRVGKAYSNGMVIDSIGGGVCQVSSTLYNALIRSDLEITERAPHSMTVGYVPLAADAAMADTYKNLKFKNNTKFPVYVEAITGGGEITINIYGKETRPKNQEEKFRSETVEVYYPGADIVTHDSSMLEGQMIVTQSSHTGYKAQLWKDIYRDGKKIDSVLVNTSVYQSAPRRVTVGTRKPEPKVEKKKEEPSSKKADEKKQENVKPKAEEKKPEKKKADV